MQRLQVGNIAGNIALIFQQICRVHPSASLSNYIGTKKIFVFRWSPAGIYGHFGEKSYPLLVGAFIFLSTTTFTEKTFYFFIFPFTLYGHLLLLRNQKVASLFFASACMLNFLLHRFWRTKNRNFLLKNNIYILAECSNCEQNNTSW